ncbi:MAG: hypothetical protein ACRD5H_16655 [Nitrososphaerales archaeon]
MPLEGYETITVKRPLYNGLRLKAVQENRSISNLTETILLKAGVEELGDKQLEKKLKEEAAMQKAGVQ